MKKIYFFVFTLIVLSLSACSNQEKTTQTGLKDDNQQITTNKEETKITETIKKVEKDDMNASNKNNNLEKDVKKETEQKKITQEEIKQVKKEYSEKLEKLETLGGYDKIERLQVLANANCLGVCDLDMKDKLTKIELKEAQICYKQCVEKQNQAKKKLKEIEKQLEQEKQAYPGKCLQDAKQRYEQMEKVREGDKQQFPKGYKQPSKEKMIQSDAERCILIYGWTNYDCEKIKKYKKPYEKCKKLRQLQQDIDFIQNWKYKTFDDYLKNKNMF